MSACPKCQKIACHCASDILQAMQHGYRRERERLAFHATGVLEHGTRVETAGVRLFPTMGRFASDIDELLECLDRPVNPVLRRDIEFIAAEVKTACIKLGWEIPPGLHDDFAHLLPVPTIWSGKLNCQLDSDLHQRPADHFAAHQLRLCLMVIQVAVLFAAEALCLGILLYGVLP